MHMQLPGAFVQRGRTAADTAPCSQEGAIPLDRLQLHRGNREVKFYFAKNQHKRCYDQLSEEQVKSIVSILQGISRGKSGHLVFAGDVYLISPKTRTRVA